MWYFVGGCKNFEKPGTQELVDINEFFHAEKVQLPEPSAIGISISIPLLLLCRDVMVLRKKDSSNATLYVKQHFRPIYTDFGPEPGVDDFPLKV